MVTAAFYVTKKILAPLLHKATSRSRDSIFLSRSVLHPSVPASTNFRTA
jgi:hypothetical protein